MTRRRAPRWTLPAILTLIVGVWALSSLRATYPGESAALEGIASLPVLNGGRVKPLDSVARNSLLLLSGKQSLRTDEGRVPAIRWLMDVAFLPAAAETVPVFEIDDPDVLGLMGLEQTDSRLRSAAELRPHFAEIETQADRANGIKSADRNRFEGAIVNLYDKLILYQRLQNTFEAAGTFQARHDVQALEARAPELLGARAGKTRPDEKAMRAVAAFIEKFQFMDRAAAFQPLPLRSPDGLEWMSPGQASLHRLAGGPMHPALSPLAEMGDAWREKRAADFHAATVALVAAVAADAPKPARLAKTELAFNHAEPFYRAMVLYVAAFVIVMISWLAWRDPLSRAAYTLLLLAFIIHTAGLIARMVLQGRPPVTNLYSSAIFVGWGSVLLGLILERGFRYGVSTAVSAMIGFCTLIIAHHLAQEGDTLEMMRAVLDSNFWLATHVTTITIGYSSTFLAGFLGAVYIVRRVIVRGPDATTRAAIERMVYGVVCFSLFFSFLGTVLGGIWADQSWGRFWGWDPKENGALMIVLWNAFVLHVRWGKLAGARGLMAMAVFGNVVTAFSWFGVNMLGIGLHSYGFMDKSLLWLVIFSISQLILIAAAFLPAGRATRSRAT